MGREASCHCRWATEEAEVRALLETRELILRGGIRRNIRFAEMRYVSADEDYLTFQVGADRVALKLGRQAAARWAGAITEPPSLAKKLGISTGKAIAVFGSLQDEALEDAFTKATPSLGRESELIFLLAQTPEQLETLLKRCEAEMTSRTPVWVVYPKGKGKPLSESQIRATLRGEGMVDTKVVSVSANVTALRFSRRKAETIANKTRQP